jgi:hypothetical protein
VLRGVAMIRVVLVERNVVLMDVAMSVCIQQEVLSHHLVCIVLWSCFFTCGLSDLLLLTVGSLVVFVLREYILKVHVLISSEHRLCQI